MRSHVDICVASFWALVYLFFVGELIERDNTARQQFD